MRRLKEFLLVCFFVAIYIERLSKMSYYHKHMLTEVGNICRGEISFDDPAHVSESYRGYFETMCGQLFTPGELKKMREFLLYPGFYSNYLFTVVSTMVLQVMIVNPGYIKNRFNCFVYHIFLTGVTALWLTSFLMDTLNTAGDYNILDSFNELDFLKNLLTKCENCSSNKFIREYENLLTFLLILLIFSVCWNLIRLYSIIRKMKKVKLTLPTCNLKVIPRSTDNTMEASENNSLDFIGGETKNEKIVYPPTEEAPENSSSDFIDGETKKEVIIQLQSSEEPICIMRPGGIMKYGIWLKPKQSI